MGYLLCYCSLCAIEHRFFKLFGHFKIIKAKQGFVILFVTFSTRTVPETKGWDVFRDPPEKVDSGSMANQQCLELTVKILKVVAYLVTFVIVLASGVISKGTLLFMTSQIKADKVTVYCNRELGKTRFKFRSNPN